MRFSLLTLLLIMLCLSTGLLVFLRSEAWIPTAKTYTIDEFTTYLGGRKLRRNSPDGTRKLDNFEGDIYELSGAHPSRNALYTFGLRDFSSPLDALLGLGQNLPMHKAGGFIDDTKIAFAHYENNTSEE